MLDNNFSSQIPEGIEKALLTICEILKDYQVGIKSALPGISKALSDFAKAGESLRVYNLALEKCKNNQWVICHHIDSQARASLANENVDVNAVMYDYYAENNHFNFRQLYNKHIVNPFLSPSHKLILSEMVDTFLKYKSYDIVPYPLCAVFDGILSQFTHQYTASFKKRMEKYNELTLDKMIEKEELQNSQEVNIWGIAHTFEAIISFTEYSSFLEAEPVTLSRHWIMHGRSNRIISEIDCFKIFNFVFALLQLGDISMVAEGE